MIEDLKSMVKKIFCASTMTPMSHSEFENLIEELYSTNGNYEELKGTVIQYFVMENLEAFRASPWTEVLMSLPDFMFDVCQALMKNGIAHAIDPWGILRTFGTEID